MNRISKCLVAAAVAAAGLTAVPAAAQLQFGRMDTGLYLGGSVGGSKYRNACEGTPAGVSCDEKDVAWRAFAGWQFNRMFGIEAGYANLGEAEASGPGGTASARARGVDLVGVISFPVGQLFSIYGKAGLARMETKGSAPGISASDTSTDLTYGAGVRFNFTRNFAARVEWQRYQDLADAKGDYFSLGLLYGWY